MATLLPLAVEGLVSLFPFSDEVAVFTNDFQQVFQNARTIKATIKEDSKVMQHPLESGASIVDHRVILPVEIELSLILTPRNYKDTFRIISNFFQKGTTLIVQTKASTYYNMIISSMPHEESTEIFNTVTIALSLTETQFALTTIAPNSSRQISPKNPANSSNVSRGQQNTQTVPTSTLARAANYIKGFF